MALLSSLTQRTPAISWGFSDAVFQDKQLQQKLPSIMLSTEQIRAHLATLTYLPGWKFDVYEGRWEGPHLVIRTIVEDSYHPGEKQHLDVHTPLPPIPDTNYLEVFLQWRLNRIATHEAREFLRKDGRPIFDPHAPDADRDNPDWDPAAGLEMLT